MTEINDIRDKYNDERIFILGNGPNINKAPFEELKSEYTLAMNNINKVYNETDWRPSFYYLPQSPYHPQTPNSFKNGNYLTKNIDLGIPCFIDCAYSDTLKSEKNIMYVNKLELWGINPFHKSSKSEMEELDIDHLRKYWSNNVSHFLFHYHAMYGALQIASYMGFSRIYLLGCDLGFEYINPHMISSNGIDPHRFEGGKVEFLKESCRTGNIAGSLLNGIAMEIIEKLPRKQLLDRYISTNAEDHFASDYYRGIQIQDGPKHEREILKSHVAAKRILEDNGIHIYNATEGGDLEVYERRNINELV